VYRRGNWREASLSIHFRKKEGNISIKEKCPEEEKKEKEKGPQECHRGTRPLSFIEGPYVKKKRGLINGRKKSEGPFLIRGSLKSI